MSNSNLEKYINSVRAVFVEYDPLGLCGPDDEYDDVLGGVVKLLRSGGNENQIAEFLNERFMNHYGVNANLEDLISFSTKIMNAVEC